MILRNDFSISKNAAADQRAGIPGGPRGIHAPPFNVATRPTHPVTSAACLQVRKPLMYHRPAQMPNCPRCEELRRLLDQANATYRSALHRQERLSRDDPGR